MDGIQAFFGEDTNGEGFLDKIKVRFSAFGEKIGEWFETIGPKLNRTGERKSIHDRSVYEDDSTILRKPQNGSNPEVAMA